MAMRWELTGLTTGETEGGGAEIGGATEGATTGTDGTTTLGMAGTAGTDGSAGSAGTAGSDTCAATIANNIKFVYSSAPFLVQ